MGEEGLDELVDNMVEDMNKDNVILRDKPFTDYEKKQMLNKMLKEMNKRIIDNRSKMIKGFKDKEVRAYLRETFRKDNRIISRKRFKKLLYSIGYGRKEAGNIIELEYESKGYYDLDDFNYWRNVRYEE